MQKLDEFEKRLFYIATSMVIMTIIALVLFAMGYTLLFYIVAVIAVIVGIYLAYEISELNKMTSNTLKKQASTKRKRSSR
jgi:uncharacterized membrane protein